MEDLRRAQLRTLLSVDDMVDSVFEHLEESGELDNTLAIFLSDNGFLWGEHGSAGKRLPYTDSVSIPLLARWPGHFASGASDERLVATIDLAPTILEAAGLSGAAAMDGHSLLDAGFSRDRILLEHWLRSNRTTPDWASFYSNDSQYVEYYLADRFVVEFREYYDLTTDPFELTNLFGDGDTSNDPDTTSLSLDLAKAVRCEGSSGLDPCP
jgi:arylsulfatase A-like enzyme